MVVSINFFSLLKIIPSDWEIGNISKPFYDLNGRIELSTTTKSLSVTRQIAPNWKLKWSLDKEDPGILISLNSNIFSPRLLRGTCNIIYCYKNQERIINGFQENINSKYRRTTIINRIIKFQNFDTLEPPTDIIYCFCQFSLQRAKTK